MSKIIWFPIENLPERYSGQWHRWFENEFERLEIENLKIYGTTLSNTIRQGSFLDVVGTNYFKADQLKQFCFMIENNFIKDNDIILVHDMWFPGLEMLAYIRDALDIKFKIFGILHSGTYDPYDFLAQKGMRKWGKHLERCWLEMYDGVFVATKFHKDLILSGTNFFETGSINLDLKDKIHITSLPIYPEFVKHLHKDNIVVFPHRLDMEKQPEMFDDLKNELQPQYPNWQFAKTKDFCENKNQYYILLNQSKISVSMALQETFGICMVESILCGCRPVVPNRLSYQDLYPKTQRYDSYEELIDMVKNEIGVWETSPIEIIEEDLRPLQERFIKSGAEAISNMINIMMDK